MRRGMCWGKAAWERRGRRCWRSSEAWGGGGWGGGGGRGRRGEAGCWRRWGTEESGATRGRGGLRAIRVRARVVETRTGLINAARGVAKAMGERLPKCDADGLGVEQMKSFPAELQELLRPLLEQVESLTEKIRASEAEIEQIARDEYPETALLRQ